MPNAKVVAEMDNVEYLPFWRRLRAYWKRNSYLGFWRGLALFIGLPAYFMAILVLFALFPAETGAALLLVILLGLGFGAFKPPSRIQQMPDEPEPSGKNVLPFK